MVSSLSNSEISAKRPARITPVVCETPHSRQAGRAAVRHVAEPAARLPPQLGTSCPNTTPRDHEVQPAVVVIIAPGRGTAIRSRLADGYRDKTQAERLIRSVHHAKGIGGHQPI